MKTNKFELTLVRHGETVANTKNIIQGQSDTALSENGLRQAALAADFLKDAAFDAVYSSDLSRAMTTARAIAPYAEVVPCPELREWNLGAWQGHTLDEVKKMFPDEVAGFFANSHSLRVTGGESYDGIYGRVDSFLSKLEQKYENGGRVLLVSHTGALRMIFARLMGKDNVYPRPPQILNGSVSVFARENGVWQLQAWNISTHLSGVISLSGRY